MPVRVDTEDKQINTCIVCQEIINDVGIRREKEPEEKVGKEGYTFKFSGPQRTF